MDFELKYKPFSEHSILIEWPAEIALNILEDVLIFKAHIENSNIKSILQINNAYNSILVIYKYTIDKIYDEIPTLKGLYFSRTSKAKRITRRWKVPVCYDEEFGLDLDEISKEKKHSISDIISLHSKADYTVFFIGFLPGFLYLGGLDERLYVPRKKSPRLEVRKGAVAIGGQQTGIYPNASPGGWHIIGNSPLEFFDLNKDRPCFANSGDKIQFFPIDRSEYQTILTQIETGAYQLESEVVDD
ncbi:5-oxoprolinase subunit PxpB [Psychroserpens luteolus]|uniref:5-oxoprolinase subunit PxpB n=1 Tax=Psychroserpens luteolus TaxID=2855840 RepID=UPI001E44F48F|nr:5-oxoprolinase subunit PxpB [Psychroserpens luteolus]MCD2259114.1 5-oxoprolinase subunit PxpB [Psychroserpens luteolus]